MLGTSDPTLVSQLVRRTSQSLTVLNQTATSQQETSVLYDLFGDDAETNNTAWTRVPQNPIIDAQGSGWADDFIAPSSIVEDHGQLRLYAEGSFGHHEQIGLFSAAKSDIPDAVWTPSQANPVLKVAASGPDCGGVFDPAVVRFRDRWFMYSSATQGDAHAFAEQLSNAQAEDLPTDEAIGLAISDDGEQFAKHPSSPIIAGRCPFAVVHDNVLHLFYIRVSEGGYRIYLALSDDGVEFRPAKEEPVLDVGPAGSWDSHSVLTQKIFVDGGRFCMSYAGDSTRLDDPTGFGLAYSDDLVNWEKFSGTQVFGVGPQSAFDSVSVSSPVIRRIDDRYYLWYAGSDRLLGDGLHSLIGLAWIPASD
jgi:predicted GH43/DUF377 family glycosyl hydrolase